MGTPDERDIRKACGRASQVVVLSYGRTAQTWWNLNRNKLEKLDNLTVLWLPQEITQALAALAERSMQLQCSLQDGVAWFTSGETTLQVEPVTLMTAPGAGRDHA